MLHPNTIYDVEEGYQLPLLTPGSAQPSTHSSIARAQPYVLRPETFLQPPSRPVSFARGRPSAGPKVTGGNLRAFLPSDLLPRSHPQPFTSSAAYNAYARSLQPLGETPRPYTHLVSVPIPIYGNHHQDVFQQDSGYNSQAGPSRRDSENPAFRPNGGSHGVSSPSRNGTNSTSTSEKTKVRKKQGPSVKRTEVGMACQFCRRRSVESRSSLSKTYGWRADLHYSCFVSPRIYRKIRCSGEKPCRNCIRLKKECLYVPVSATSTQPSRGKKRPRSADEGDVS